MCSLNLSQGLEMDLRYIFVLSALLGEIQYAPGLTRLISCIENESGAANKIHLSTFFLFQTNNQTSFIAAILIVPYE